MPPVTIPNTLVDGTTVEAADLNDNFDALADAINGNLGTDNLETPYALFCHTARLTGPISSATTDGTNVFRFKCPTGMTLVPVEFQCAYELESATTATGTFQATANGVNMLSAALTLNTPDTVVTSTSFGVASVTTGQVIIGTVAVSADSISHVTVTLFFKAYLQG